MQLFKKNICIRYDSINILNEEMNDILKIVKFLEESSLLIKCISETLKKSKIIKRWNSWYVIRYIRCYSLLGGSLLAVKGTIRADET